MNGAVSRGSGNDMPDFSETFHEFSKDFNRGHPPIPLDADDWPEDWKTTYYKGYSRTPKLRLDNSPPIEKPLSESIFDRASGRDFVPKPISLETISSLLKYSAGLTRRLQDGRLRRSHPSGGARFPIEIYPIVFRGGNGLNSGLYHYNIKDHALDVLWEREFTPDDIDGLFTYPWVKDASMAIVMTAVFSRTQSKYGERGYRYILLEAGHIGQNFYLVSGALGLKCCALGGTKDEALEKLIDIDGVTESVVYGLVMGRG